MSNSTPTSRVGRKPVAVPSNVKIDISETTLVAKGPKGSLSMDINPYATVKFEDNQLTVSQGLGDFVITGQSKKLYRSIIGTVRATLANIIKGVTDGIERKLTLVGVGYKAQVKGKMLSLSLGYSHPTDFAIPEGITIETPTPTEIIVKGLNKQQVGQVAAKIRSIRPPEPYKGKGVRYANEVVEIKETKKK